MSPFPLSELLFQGSQAILLCSVWMASLWLLHLPLKNASIIDAGWPLGIGGASLLYAWYGNGLLERRWLIACMTLLWALRLSGFLVFARVFTKGEDGRYQALRKEWGGAAWWKFLIYAEAKAVLGVVLSLPVFLACGNGRAEFTVLEKAAAILWVIALSAEAIADSQLSRFLGKAVHQGQVCREGFWAWSRHPNYFFECLVWVSYAVFALSAPWGFLGLLAPAIVYLQLRYVTGVGPAEAQALRLRGWKYEEYQRTVSEFYPMPPKA